MSCRLSVFCRCVVGAKSVLVMSYCYGRPKVVADICSKSQGEPTSGCRHPSGKIGRARSGCRHSPPTARRDHKWLQTPSRRACEAHTWIQTPSWTATDGKSGCRHLSRETWLALLFFNSTLPGLAQTRETKLGIQIGNSCAPHFVQNIGQCGCLLFFCFIFLII